MAKPQPKMLFQEGKEEPYAGAEHRGDKKRPPDLPPHLQNLLEALDQRVSCRNNCVISEEAQPHIGHAVGVIKDKGDGSIPRGLNRWRDQDKEVEEALSSYKNAKKRVVDTILWVITVLMIGLIGLGIVQKIRGG